MAFEYLVDLAQYLADLFAKRFGLDAKMNVRCSYLEIADEYVAQALVVVLTSVYGDVFAMLIKHPEDQAESNYFRPRAENRHYFHKM
jgi:hypothetical protein